MASRLALDNDLPEAFITEPEVVADVVADIDTAGAVCAGRAVSTVEVIGAAVDIAGLVAGRAGADGFAPIAVRPFWDSARRLSSATARDERGVVVLFAIGSLMLSSSRIHSILAQTELAGGARSIYG